MIVDLSAQVREDPALVVPSVRVYTGAPLPLVVAGLPPRLGGVPVASVVVTVVNADGVALAVPFARASDGRRAFGSIAASHFARYGKVTRGFAVACLDASGVVLGEWRRTLDVQPGGVGVEPGDASRTFQEKGGDQFIKTEIVEGVQHYAKIELARDPRVNSYLARYTGDYILVDGTFQEIVQ